MVRHLTEVENGGRIKAMKTNNARVLLSLIAAVAILASPAAAEDKTVKIMPLGDSITQGFRGKDSYRRGLWLKLKEKGLDIDFVGSLKENYLGRAAHTDFDMDHEGHYGWRTDQVLAEINGWAKDAPADIVLIHLGTNDLGLGQDIDETVDELRQIIEIIKKHNPTVTIIVAQIIPVASIQGSQQIRVFNSRLPKMAESMTTESSKVVVADLFTGFDPWKDTYDNIHPNAAGNEKMVANWYKKLAEVLKIPDAKEPEKEKQEP
jgi:acyl-CoA thioesterase-1